MTYRRPVVVITLAIVSVAAITLAIIFVIDFQNMHGADTTSNAIETQYTNLSSKYSAAKKALEEEYKNATTEQKTEIKQKKLALSQEYAQRCLDVAKINLHDKNAFEPLYWVVIEIKEGKSLDEALILLRENFADDKDKPASFFVMLPELLERQSDEINPFLLRVIERNSINDVRGSACVYLAIRLKMQAELFGNHELADESAQLFERAINEFAEAKCRGSMVGERAKFELNNLRGPLGIGHVAPDSEGVDLDGVKFKLSDYHGKVILLSFCGQWCGCCRKMYPHEQLLLERLADKPFVFIEVNSDGDRNSHKEFMKENNLTWRCFSDGNRGPIWTIWEIQASPTYYVLDRNGIIRYKAFDVVDDATLTKWTDTLLNEKAPE